MERYFLNYSALFRSNKMPPLYESGKYSTSLSHKSPNLFTSHHGNTKKRKSKDVVVNTDGTTLV